MFGDEHATAFMHELNDETNLLGGASVTVPPHGFEVENFRLQVPLEKEERNRASIWISR